jgi:hypothetical protein
MSLEAFERPFKGLLKSFKGRSLEAFECFRKPRKVFGGL